MNTEVIKIRWKLKELGPSITQDDTPFYTGGFDIDKKFNKTKAKQEQEAIYLLLDSLHYYKELFDVFNTSCSLVSV